MEIVKDSIIPAKICVSRWVFSSTGSSTLLLKETFFTMTFWSLPETFIRTSLFSSSGSCHDRDVMWQEISCMCGSACSCPRPGSRIVVPVSDYVLPASLIHLVLLSDSLSKTVVARTKAATRWAMRMKDFFPRHVSIMARTRRRTEQASSDEGLS